MPGFTLELEANTFKKRAGIYLKKELKYTRRTDLEKENFHVVIIDVFLNVKIRIINIYRSFRPPNGMTPDVFFAEQLRILKNALCSSCYIMGDFNLDARMNHRMDYNRKVPLKLLNDFALENHLIQIVNFNTWSRNINGIRKESRLDHVYVNNSATVNNVNFINPTFGDHVLVMLEINLKVAEKPNFQLRRDWRCYSESRQKFRIVNLLSSLNVNYDVLNVQERWNIIENVIIECIDKCAPLVSVDLNF